MLKTIMSDEQNKVLRKFEIDFSIQISNQSRFVNAFHNIYGPVAVFREIPIDIRDLDQLGFPVIVKNLTNASKGLILVVSQLAVENLQPGKAFLDHINNNRKSHIITIEDPVEFTHKNKIFN